MPEYNQWDSNLLMKVGENGEPIVDIRKEKNTLMGHDSESIINSSLELSLFQASVTETIIFIYNWNNFKILNFYQII